MRGLLTHAKANAMILFFSTIICDASHEQKPHKDEWTRHINYVWNRRGFRWTVLNLNAPNCRTASVGAETTFWWLCRWALLCAHRAPQSSAVWIVHILHTSREYARRCLAKLMLIVGCWVRMCQREPCTMIYEPAFLLCFCLGFTQFYNWQDGTQCISISWRELSLSPCMLLNAKLVRWIAIRSRAG